MNATRARLEAPPPADPEAPVRGGWLLRPLDRLMGRAEQAVGRHLPEHLNPLAQSGAVAITSLAVATITGILLLLWYVPSVHQAYASVEAMAEAPLTAGLMRSLHRYSSDAAMLFGLWHAVRLLAARRFGGPRWLAWVTGIAAVAVMWFIGWTGYWLVWDERAQLVATGTAKMVDVLPVFVEPLSRTFLTDASVNSLLFFVVFFLHMLVPLALVLFLWLHVARVARPRFLTVKPLTWAILISMVAISLVHPATSAGPARMLLVPERFTLDGWYLLPLLLTDRLGGGALWGITLLGTVGLLAVPWALVKRRVRPALVQPNRCNACQQCVIDCPYDAIRMVPDPDSRKGSVALVDPSKCVGCGICAGACDSQAIGLDWFPVLDQRKQVDAWVDEAVRDGATPRLAFTCASGAGGGPVDGEGVNPDLPGWKVMPVPCAGWVHALSVERALRHGAQGVMVVTCGTGACRFREGPTWVGERLEGKRPPVLRKDKVDADRVRVVAADPWEIGRLRAEATAFAAELKPPEPRRRPWVVALASAAVLSVVAVLGSEIGYATPTPDQPELVVSFFHAGRADEACRPLTEAEQQALPVHMRRDQVCERARPPVRLQVLVDGQVVHEQAYPASGLWGDGSSTAVVRLGLQPGTRQVEVALGDSADPEAWAWRDAREVELVEGRRRVVLFDRHDGFTWH